MEQIFLTALARYNAYANQTLLETAAKIPFETLSATPSPSRNSALILIRHMLDTEVFFLAQLQGGTSDIDFKSITSMEQIRSIAQEHEQKFLSYMDALDDSAFTHKIEVMLGEHPLRLLVGQILLQVFMHSAQHRGELSIILSSLGYPLPIDDIIVQFVEQSGQTWPWKNTKSE